MPHSGETIRGARFGRIESGLASNGTSPSIYTGRPAAQKADHSGPGNPPSEANSIETELFQVYFLRLAPDPRDSTIALRWTGAFAASLARFLRTTITFPAPWSPRMNATWSPVSPDLEETSLVRATDDSPLLEFGAHSSATGVTVQITDVLLLAMATLLAHLAEPVAPARRFRNQPLEPPAMPGASQTTAEPPFTAHVVGVAGLALRAEAHIALRAGMHARALG